MTLLLLIYLFTNNFCNKLIKNPQILVKRTGYVANLNATTELPGVSASPVSTKNLIPLCVKFNF